MSTKKQPEKNLPAASEPTQAPVPTTKTASVLPSLAGANPALQERMLEVRDNMESVENFRLPRAKMTAEGFELIEGEEPLEELEGVIVHTKKTNVYYAKPYNPSDVSPPDCFSNDGVTPDKSIAKPVHVSCKGCPMAEFGTNSMKSGKACRNLKPMYLLLGDESIMPRQVTVTPASLKAANQYLMDLTERGISYRKVKTKIVAYKENPRDTYRKLKFAIAGKLDPQRVTDVEFLKNQWLPVMNAQIVDQREMDGAQPTPEATANGDY